MNKYRFDTRVSYGDIDDKLELTLEGSMRMMQEAAIIHSAHAGFSVYNVSQTRVIWMLVQWRVRMIGVARWNESVTVVTWPQSMEKLTSIRCFRIEDAEGKEIAVAESKWLLVSLDTGHAIRIPDHVASAYPLCPERVFQSDDKRFVPEKGCETYSCVVQRRDLDTNHHMNNLVYLELAREAIPEFDLYKRFSELSVYYHRQLLLGDKVCCFYSPLAQGGCCVQICGEDGNRVHCTIEFRTS